MHNLIESAFAIDEYVVRPQLTLQLFSGAHLSFTFQEH